MLERVDKLPPEWPTEEDYINLRALWRSQGGQSGPYASYRQCKSCNDMLYCYGKTYENQICFNCFVDRNKPKKRRQRK